MICSFSQSSKTAAHDHGRRASRRARVTGSILAVLCTGWLVGGCLSRPSLSRQSFAFAIPEVGATAGQGTNVLEIRQLKVAAPFDNQSFVYRTGEFSYERDPYDQFLAAPEEIFVAPMRGYLLKSASFDDVVSETGTIKPAMTATIYIGQLYGDFRNHQAPAAVLDMTFQFFKPGAGGQSELWLQKQYEQRVPFHERTAAALMAAWNQALQRTMEAVIADLKKAAGASGQTAESGKGERRAEAKIQRSTSNFKQ
jgi:hypothetical protein